MKRLVFAGAFFVLLAAISALIWFGQYFISYAIPPEKLSVDKIAPQLADIGKPLTLDLHGTGFNDKTSVSLVMDVSNRDAVVGSLPLEGVYNESLILDNYLYLARDRGGLEVLDIHIPQEPHLLKSYLAGRTIVDIHHHGQYLFLSCGKLGLAIMQPLPGGGLKFISEIVPGVAVWGARSADAFLFLATKGSGIQIYDIRQPQHSRLVATLNDGLSISSLVLFENYLYSPGLTGIDIYRIDNPQHPEFVSSLVMKRKLKDLIVQDRQLFLTTEGEVALYDLKDKENPHFLKRWAISGAAEKVFAGRDHVYFSDNFSGLRIVNPLNESLGNLINLSVSPRTLSETEDCLFVAGFNQGLLVLDKKTLLPRQVADTIHTTGNVHDLYIRGHWMFVANARGGVSLHDLTNKGKQFPLVTHRKSESFAVWKDRLYVAQGRRGIEVIDISRPDKPKSLYVWSKLPATRIAVVDDSCLVLSNGTKGLQLVDISNCSNPVVRDSLRTLHPLNITVDGSLIFVGSKSQGLLIYRIDDFKFDCAGVLSTPFPMNIFDTTLGVQVEKGIAYIANGRSGMVIANISDPVHPVILSSVGIPGISKAISIADHRAYVVNHQGGISIFDVTDPEKPVLKNRIEMLGLSRGIQIVDKRIYVTHRSVGVTVIPVPVEADITDMEKHWMNISFSSPAFPGRYSLQISNGHDLVIRDGVIVYR